MQLQRLASPKSAGWAGRPDTQDTQWVQFQSEGNLLEDSLLLRDAGLFVVFRLSSDWMSPPYIVEGNWCSHFTDLNVNIIKVKNDPLQVDIKLTITET